jgi:hypothetical protein
LFFLRKAITDGKTFKSRAFPLDYNAKTVYNMVGGQKPRLPRRAGGVILAAGLRPRPGACLKGWKKQINYGELSKRESKRALAAPSFKGRARPYRDCALFFSTGR